MLAFCLNGDSTEHTGTVIFFKILMPVDNQLSHRLPLSTGLECGTGFIGYYQSSCDLT